MKALTQTDFHFAGQKSVYHGKVRDVYDSDGDLVIDSGIAFAIDKNLQSFTQTGGIISSKTSTLNTRISSSQKNIETLEGKLKKKEQDLKIKYGQMEAALNSLEKQADSITNFSDNQKSGR